jgi:hypothetical protein
MKQSRPRRPSAALLISCLALFVALGGTVYAGSKINGKSVKKNTLPGNRIKKNTLPGNKIKKDSLTGTQINESTLSQVPKAASAASATSAGSLASVQYVAVVVPLVKELDNGVTGIAPCPAGTNVIGGGATVVNHDESGVGDSGPTAARTGWEATGFAGEDGLTMTVTAICTAVASSSG